MPLQPCPITADVVASTYLRYSSDLQRDASINDQHRACSAKIEQQN